MPCAVSPTSACSGSRAVPLLARRSATRRAEYSSRAPQGELLEGFVLRKCLDKHLINAPGQNPADKNRSAERTSFTSQFMALKNGPDIFAARSRVVCVQMSTTLYSESPTSNIDGHGNPRRRREERMRSAYRGNLLYSGSGTFPSLIFSTFLHGYVNSQVPRPINGNKRRFPMGPVS